MMGIQATLLLESVLVKREIKSADKNLKDCFVMKYSR